MHLSAEQTSALAAGAPIPLLVDGSDCVLVRRDVYERTQPVEASGIEKLTRHADSPVLADLLAGITPDNIHAEVDWGVEEGAESW